MGIACVQAHHRISLWNTRQPDMLLCPETVFPVKSIVIPMLISSSLISTENVFGSVLSIPIPVLCRRVFPRPFPGERSRPAAEAAHLYRRQQVGSKL